MGDKIVGVCVKCGAPCGVWDFCGSGSTSPGLPPDRGCGKPVCAKCVKKCAYYIDGTFDRSLRCVHFCSLDCEPDFQAVCICGTHVCGEHIYTWQTEQDRPTWRLECGHARCNACCRQPCSRCPPPGPPTPAAPAGAGAAKRPASAGSGGGGDGATGPRSKK
jgi:hypothetical protein